MSAGSDRDEHDHLDLHDRIINHIHASGLTLAGILRLQQVDDNLAEQLRSAIHDLDRAVHGLRRVALTRHVETSGHVAIAAPDSEPAQWRRRLCRFSVDEVFAYAIGGHDFYRAGDHTLWAHENDGLLLSARSGRPLAHREGKVFYDVESEQPLYYEQQNPDAEPDRS